MFAGFVIKGLGEVRSRFCQSELRFPSRPALNYTNRLGREQQLCGSLWLFKSLNYETKHTLAEVSVSSFEKNFELKIPHHNTMCIGR